MARNNKNTVGFAENGDRQATTFTYDEGWTAAYDFQQSGAAALPVPMPFVNQIHYEISQGVADNNRYGGALPWDTTIAFEQYAVVTGTDGNTYVAVQANQGVDPTTDGGTNWLQIAPTVAEFDAYKALLASTSGAAQIGQSDPTFGATVQSAFSDLSSSGGATTIGQNNANFGINVQQVIDDLTTAASVTNSGAFRVRTRIGNVSSNLQQITPWAYGSVGNGATKIGGFNFTVSNLGGSPPARRITFDQAASNADYAVIFGVRDTNNNVALCPKAYTRVNTHFDVVTSEEGGSEGSYSFDFAVFIWGAL